ncbi:uncharacterized protein YuzB (UPF0349 family) [Anaerosolibacter carboniphilus]|uniref:Uncharacterized protein YuzB (UPF0349 family) n=1 Tax=Anaerosolibacter carboniphilus TaxID=1417629 RepID=A0A841KY21_9FIRM|nr:DUF1450 domain-containing protein [Anaerosolibacter carboniphilus]MBB6216890.1 uncharacterized protein YuzB (UPF0349 family) [Anaerosolibacter carboniphilus]
MATIKICENNFGYGTNDVVERIHKERADVTVDVASCQGYCDICAVGPYAFVDDTLIEAETADELYNKIINIL